jgi:hypothetical protein
MIRRERWVNTSGGSNKDYIITYNDTDFCVDSEWGRVGVSARKGRHQVCKDPTEMIELVEAKRARRVAHGYWLASSDVWDDSVSAWIIPTSTPRRAPRRDAHTMNFLVDQAELV